MRVLVIAVPQILALRSGVVPQALKQKLDGGGCIGCENDVKIPRVGVEETQRSEPDRMDTLAGMQRRYGV